ncbi:LysE family translocator [Aliivibrio fischeri]|uniref:LysE family translocator n=1 Tax=Aliivibrio fischeri TaxID=668 RepID=UPI0007C4574C|nr:LysE family translocator [Aliivibrio fischeri]MBP3139673.1 LysE family translocator [Aliivibrio fischeri]MBP3154058.1 LysE family translocator [Aliivibrio fischeri]MCE7554865.1 LysE family translocator [Aliivibrio fischeri]MCE7562133.1 LysE family translocator [Aliivibrio fischeri]MCE7565651.1 LysE family translocator [Aliivibrio fischeri]
MEYPHLLALITFAFVGAFTPGPNNIMLMASGANVGFVRTIPHMLGVIFGFAFMLVLVGFGLIQIFHTYPQLEKGLQVVSAIYLLYLAYKIARSEPVDSRVGDYKPMSFLAAASFQWVNPKGWSMALSVMSIYATTSDMFSVLLIAFVFICINVPTVSFWTVAGKELQKRLKTPKHLKLFNYSMAGLLVGSMVMGF